MILFHEVNIVCCHEFCIGFTGKPDEFRVLYFLLHVGFGIGSRFIGFVALEFEVKIIAEHFFVPENRFFGFFHVSRFNFFVNFAPKTGRACNDSLAVLSQ